MKQFVIFVALVSFLFAVSSCQANTQQQWQKMNASKTETYRWFNDAKYGMFIHWGVYAIPGGVWKGKKMEEMRSPHVAEWVQYAAEIPRSEYCKLSSEFNPVNFDADFIAQLAKDAGMKYLVITSKHHDGFAMYDSKCSDWDITDATPFKRDVVDELYKACKKRDIEFGLYYSHNIDWMDGHDCQYSMIKAVNDAKGEKTQKFGPNLWDPSPNTFDEYLENKAFPQVKEILTKFPDMKQLWYDMSRYMTPEQSYAFYKTAYDLQPQIMINERVGNDFGDFDIPGDNKIPENPDEITKPWQTVGTLNNSWGYKSYDNDWKLPKELLFWLVEIVSKGGNYMLNIGPDAMGNVPEQSVTNLREVGKWLRVNGQAIYGTGKWKIAHEGPTNIKMKGTNVRAKEGFNITLTPEDFWFTQKDCKLYVIALEYPVNGVATIKSLSGTDVKAVNMLGVDMPLAFEATKTALQVTLANVMPNPNGYVLEITLRK